MAAIELHDVEVQAFLAEIDKCEGDVFLDDVSVTDVENELGVRVCVTDGSGESLVEEVSKED